MSKGILSVIPTEAEHPNKWTKLLRQWIDGYHLGLREHARRFGRDWQPPPEPSDHHFLQSMFRTFGHHCSAAGRRVGAWTVRN
jgi:hypothetical protein